MKGEPFQIWITITNLRRKNDANYGEKSTFVVMPVAQMLSRNTNKSDMEKLTQLSLIATEKNQKRIRKKIVTDCNRKSSPTIKGESEIKNPLRLIKKLNLMFNKFFIFLAL